jgi:hypothetical protein
MRPENLFVKRIDAIGGPQRTVRKEAKKSVSIRLEERSQDRPCITTRNRRGEKVKVREVIVIALRLCYPSPSSCYYHRRPRNAVDCKTEGQREEKIVQVGLNRFQDSKRHIGATSLVIGWSCRRLHSPLSLLEKRRRQLLPRLGG